MGSGALRSKTPMLSNPREKPAFKEILAVLSLRFTHQLKFSISWANERLRNSRSPCPLIGLLRAKRKSACPGVYRRIDVAEVPLVGRDLTRRMDEILLQHQVELPFCEIRIDRGEREGVERMVLVRRTTDTPICRASR